MTTAPLTYTEAELLESHPFSEPLFAGGVRCHGGFDKDGTYISPRTRNRVPAIAAWQAQHQEQFGTPLLGVPLSEWPSHYPNVAQAKFLIRSGVTRPMVSTLTRIGTVEGFGAGIRNNPLPRDLQKFFDESIEGTATAHLQNGLYEAHARDEAGFADEGGHKQMWYAARDVAFEDQVSEDEMGTMMRRMGFGAGGPGAPGAGASDAERAGSMAQMRQRALENRVFPDDIDFDLEAAIARMARLMLIEISAFHTFAWAEEVLRDTEVAAGEGEAARLVSYICADETPHVEYLKTTLSEMRDRTFVGDSGRKYAGEKLVTEIWNRSLQQSLGGQRNANLDNTVADLAHALEGHPRRDALLEEYHVLGDVRPGPDGVWVENEA